jgi:hypothetical protein
MIDEAFMPLRKVIERMLSFRGEIIDDEMGVHSYIYKCEIESPVELDIGRDEQGALQIGSTPPLYYVDTSIQPSFHRVRFTAHLSEDSDGA